MARRRDAPRKQVITLDEKGVRRVLPDGRTEAVRWDDLVEVRIVTTAGGTFGEDVFFVLRGSGDAGCVVPQRAAPTSLLERLQRLPGFDNGTLVEAMGSLDDAEFICWTKKPK